MSGKTALLIVNPRSRRASDADLHEVVDGLQSAGLKVIEIAPQSRSQTAEAIAAHRDEIDRVIVAGGDGTISSTAASLYRYGLPLAILPLGTANDLARTLEIPEDLPAACQVVLGNARRKVDLGVVNGHYFFNVANIGLGTRITHELTPEVKKFFGVFSYLKALFAAYSRNRSFRLRLTIDTRQHRVRSIQVAVGNGRYYGGGNVIEENATIDDGRLALYSLAPQSFWELLALAPLLRDGRQREAQRAFSARGRRIELKTSRPMEIHADGEPVTRTPAVFEVIEKALEVFVPEASAAGPAAREVAVS